MEPYSGQRGSGAIPSVGRLGVSREVHDYGAGIEIAYSEASENKYQRLVEMIEYLEGQGCDQAELEAFQISKNYEFDYQECYREEARKAREGGRDPPSPQEWACSKLACGSLFDGVETFDDLEARVRALGQMAGASYDEIATFANRLWLTTPAGSAARDAESVAPLRSSQFSTPLKASSPPRRNGDGPFQREQAG